MTNDERDFYQSQSELSRVQMKFLKSQNKISEEQVDISKKQIEILEKQNKLMENQTKFSKILAIATVVLALAGFSQSIYYFELFSQGMIKDFYDGLAFILLAIVVFAIGMLIVNLLFNWKLFQEEKRANKIN